MELSLAIAIIGCIMAVLSLFFGRKDKGEKSTGDYQYKMGVIETKLSAISEQLKALSDKLDRYDKDTEERIREAILQHEKAYHNKGE